MGVIISSTEEGVGSSWEIASCAQTGSLLPASTPRSPKLTPSISTIFNNGHFRPANRDTPRCAP